MTKERARFCVRMDVVSSELLHSFLATSGLRVLGVLLNDHVAIAVEDRPPHAVMQVATLHPAPGHGPLNSALSAPMSKHIEWGTLLLPTPGVSGGRAGGGGTAPVMVLLGGGGNDDPIPFPKMTEDGGTVPENLLKVVRHPVEAFPPGAESAMTREEARSLADASTPSILLATFLNAHKGLSCVAMTGDASQVAAGFSDRTVRVWRLNQATGSEEEEGPLELVGHSQPTFALSWSPEQRFLLSAGGDGGIRLWDVKGRGRCLVVYRAHAAPVWDVSFSPAGHYFLSASADQTARLWSTDHCQPLRLFVGHHSDVTVAAWHPNCAYAATGSSDKTARLWDLQSGQCLRVLAGHFGTVSALAVCPTGRYLATGSEDATVRVWDLQSGAQVSLLEGHDGPVHSLDYRCGHKSHFSEAPLTNRRFHTARSSSWSGEPCSISSLLAFACTCSVDEEVIATGGADATVRLWEVARAFDVATSRADDACNLSPSHTFHTKSTPVVRVKWTRRNLLLAAGAFDLE